MINFIKRIDQSHLTLESLTIELVSNASAQLFPDSTLSSFRTFLPEQLDLESHCEVANSEVSYPSMYQDVGKGRFMFFDLKKFQSRLNSAIWRLVCTVALRILLRP